MAAAAVVAEAVLVAGAEVVVVVVATVELDAVPLVQTRPMEPEPAATKLNSEQSVWQALSNNTHELVQIKH